MPDESTPPPAHESTPADAPDPDASPFESPSYEKVERGIPGPWEKETDDD